MSSSCVTFRRDVRRHVSSGDPARAPSSTQAQSEGTQSDASKVQPRRRLPEQVLDAIEDPRERQRQHRLARIRASAAVARSAPLHPGAHLQRFELVTTTLHRRLQALAFFGVVLGPIGWRISECQRSPQILVRYHEASTQLD